MLNQPLFAALDVSLETTTICIMSFDGTHHQGGGGGDGAGFHRDLLGG